MEESGAVLDSESYQQLKTGRTALELYQFGGGFWYGAYESTEIHVRDRGSVLN